MVTKRDGARTAGPLDAAAPTVEIPTVEAWAAAYVLGTTLAGKLDPPESPSVWQRHGTPRRLTAPGRPPDLTVVARSPRTPRDLHDPARRARVLHAFMHHELQAAELMCWAICAFPGAPLPFRRGLLRLFWDEVRHLRAYARHLRVLGFSPGSFPVRDWFWERVPTCTSPVEFTAVLGVGFEGGNLDHCERFAARLEAAGDAEAAALCATVGREEEAHVRFGWRWFRRFAGIGADASGPGAAAAFDRWRASLPAPLSPILMRGLPLNRAARLRSGLPEGFVDRLERFSAEDPRA